MNYTQRPKTWEGLLVFTVWMAVWMLFSGCATAPKVTQSCPVMVFGSCVTMMEEIAAYDARADVFKCKPTHQEPLTDGETCL